MTVPLIGETNVVPRQIHFRLFEVKFGLLQFSQPGTCGIFRDYPRLLTRRRDIVLLEGWLLLLSARRALLRYRRR